MEPLRLAFHLTPEDYYRVIRAYVLRYPLYRILFGTIAVVLSCLLCITMALIVLGTSSGRGGVRPSTAFIVILITTLSILAFATTVFFRPYLYSRRVEKHGQVGDTIWELTGEGLTITSPVTKQEVRWPAFDRALELRNYYCLPLMVNRRAFQFVPKRAFESPEQEAEFRRIVETHLGPIK